jgi:hypothetical protein
MRPLVAIVAPALVLALGACGQPSSAGKFSGEEKTVATVIEDFQRHGERHEADDICNKQLTPALQEKVQAGSSSCASEMKKALEDADTFDLDVQDVSISGTTAQARVKGKDEGAGIVRTMKLEKQGSSWRISDFGS